MRLLLTSLIALSGMTTGAWAALKTQTIDYKQGDTVLEGYLAYDDSIKGKQPGIVVVHEWKGLNDYAKKRADMLAQLGYVAFAADIYGKGVRPQTLEEAGTEAVKYKEVAAFEKEMKDAGVNYRLVKYPGAKHGFTNPDNDDKNPPGALYNKAADEASWQEMQKFFKEIFT